MSFWNKFNQITGDIANSVSGGTNDALKSIHDEFIAKISFGTKPFCFSEDALIYGGEKYLYKQLSEIRTVNIPSNPLTNGVAQCVLQNGKVLTLAFDFTQKERFIKAVNYANEKIDEAKGTQKNYKYLISSTTGSKIEVYNDYIRLYYIPTGVKNIVGNVYRTGSVDIIIQIKNLSVNTEQSDEQETFNLIINNIGQVYSIPIKNEYANLVKEVISFIEQHKNLDSNENNIPEIAKRVFKAKGGITKNFPLFGRTLEITPDKDALNSYRLEFRELASACSDAAKTEYIRNVRDLTSFLQIFPNIYERYLGLVADKAMDIFISVGMWDIEKDKFIELHSKTYHLAIDLYSNMLKSIENTVNNNQNAVSSVIGLVPHLTGGGFGLKGAAKGVASATAFNFARDAIASNVISGASNISQAQQIELFKRIDIDGLFEIVFNDYWMVFCSMVCVLNKNGHTIWLPSPKEDQRCKNILANISNPNFPQDKIVDAIIDMMKTNPYNTDFIKFLISRYGETKEISDIRKYFGFIDFNNARKC